MINKKNSDIYPPLTKLYHLSNCSHDQTHILTTFIICQQKSNCHDTLLLLPTKTPWTAHTCTRNNITNLPRHFNISLQETNVNGRFELPCESRAQV